MEDLKHIKQMIISAVQGQIGNLAEVDTKELGEAIDMIKDLEEAIYYCTIVKAMEDSEKEEEARKYYRYPMMERDVWDRDRDIDRGHGRMYYSQGGSGSGSSRGGSSSQSGSMGNGSSSSGSREYSQYMMDYDEMRDSREGRSPRSRRTYMESKELHHDKNTQMRELENYMQELSTDITEMIEVASPEEKQILQKKLTALASKIV